MSASALPFYKALDTNSVATSFTAKTPTTTEPSGDGVFDLLSDEVARSVGTRVPSYLNLLPFGSNTNNLTFEMRVWGWQLVFVVKEDGTRKTVYIPQLLAELARTLASIALPADFDDETFDDNLMVDTIAVKKGGADGGFQHLISPANDTTASVLLHSLGCRWIEFDFDMTGAESGNCLWTTVD